MTDFAQIFLSLLEPRPVMEEAVPDLEDGEKEFSDSLDKDTDPKDLEVDGMPDLPSVVDSLRDELLKEAKRLEEIRATLINPEDENSLLSKIAQMQKIPEFQALYKPLSNDLTKVAVALATIVARMDAVSTIAPHDRDKRKQEDAASASSPKHPY